MSTSFPDPFKGHRFPREIISYAVWLLLKPSRCRGHSGFRSLIADVPSSTNSFVTTEVTVLSGVVPTT